MQLLIAISTVGLTVAAPYALIMAIPRTSHAVVAAAALAVPLSIGLVRTHAASGSTPIASLTGFDEGLIAIALAALVLAAFVRLTQAALGERAQSRRAAVALTILGAALVVMALPWWGHLIAKSAAN
ncbi:MAG: hypothetical protein SH859_08945 [Hyphomicrobium aestuarii]|nr:hypothetical protein [Hyphomicrobium aestuarii]